MFECPKGDTNKTMNINFSDWKIGTKLISSFSLVAFIVMLVGYLGYLGMNTMQSKTADILKASPWIDSAMEMKLSVATDMQIVMELIQSETPQALDAAWSEHEAVVATFDVFVDAILQGAETERGAGGHCPGIAPDRRRGGPVT